MKIGMIHHNTHFSAGLFHVFRKRKAIRNAMILLVTTQPSYSFDDVRIAGEIYSPPSIRMDLVGVGKLALTMYLDRYAFRNYGLLQSFRRIFRHAAPSTANCAETFLNSSGAKISTCRSKPTAANQSAFHADRSASHR